MSFVHLNYIIGLLKTIGGYPRVIVEEDGGSGEREEEGGFVRILNRECNFFDEKVAQFKNNM